MKPKNQVICQFGTTRCKVLAKYISKYFDIFNEKFGKGPATKSEMRAHDFQGGGGQLPFGTFPRIHLIW